MKGRRFISDQFRPFLWRVGNCADLSAQGARRWAWGGGIGTVWKGPQKITRLTLDGDREPGWGVWQPVPSHPVSFCHVPGEVLPSIDYSHCKKNLLISAQNLSWCSLCPLPLVFLSSPPASWLPSKYRSPVLRPCRACSSQGGQTQLPGVSSRLLGAASSPEHSGRWRAT